MWKSEMYWNMYSCGKYMLSAINFHERKGQTLIEALIALAIAVAIISAITAVVVSSLNNNTYSKNQNIARSYAQQTVEKIRGLAQSNYTTFTSKYTSPVYCIDQNNDLQCNISGNQCVSSWAGNCNNVKTGIFIREVDFESTSASCQGDLKATVKISWSDGKCTDRLNLYCHQVSTSTCFTNINTVPSPL